MLKDEFTEHREKILGQLQEDGNEEAIEILDFVMERMNQIDDVLTEVFGRLFNEIKDAKSVEMLEFLFGGINTVGSMGDAILDAVTLMSEAHLLRFQEMLLDDPTKLKKLLETRMGLSDSEAQQAADKISGAAESREDEPLKDAINLISQLEDDLQNQKKNSEKDKSNEGGFWDFSDL